MSICKLVTAFALASLVGCTAVPTSQYYTLLASSRPVAGAPPGPEKIKASTKSFAISVQPVDLPEQVDRPQIVLSSQGSTEVTPLNGSLWASPLRDEIRNALANDLSRQLGVLDISVTGAPESLPIWKVYLTVQRFESVYNKFAILDATWRLTAVNQTKAPHPVRICRAEVRIPVATGIPALIKGHQQAVHRLASVIAAQLSGGPVSASDSELHLKGCTG